MKIPTPIPRRKFLKISGLTGTFLSLGYFSVLGQPTRIVNLALHQDDPEAGLNPFIFIDTQGKITLLNHRPEMGQGTFEAIPMIIAEELEVDINQIRIEPSPADREIYGDQMVVGSQSIHRNFEWMRKTGAAAREMLLSAAASRWQIPKEDCFAKNATVYNRKNSASFTYGDLVGDARKLPAPQNPALKKKEDFTIIGQSISRQDIPSKTDGSATFGLDVEVPGMLYASILRSPVLLGKLKSFDPAESKKIKGVKDVLVTARTVFGQQRQGVAIIAENYWAAYQGRRALKVEWDNGDLASWNSGKIASNFQDASTQSPVVFEHRGDFDRAYDQGTVKIEASYETPYQAHAPMEPMNVIVSVQKDQCTFWGSTQNPNGMRDFLSRKYGIPPQKVTINYTFMGGAFGRRSLSDVTEEAADLSVKTGAPIKVIWTREDDISQGPFRACSLNICKGALDGEGRVSLSHTVICQDIRNQSGNNPNPTDGIAGGINTEYAYANYKIGGILRRLYIPVSYWRSVYHSTNCFAHESFMDELAWAAKKDPLEFRRELLKNHPQYSGVLNKVSEMSNWHSPRESGTGRGVAVMERSGAFVAMVVEVGRVAGKIAIRKIYTAIDVGIAVNPDIVRAQTEGCIIMGLTAAIKSGIKIEKGQVANKNFDTYHMMRIHESPDLEVEVIDSAAPPNGAGEGALPAVAPALANAIYDLTKTRIRRLPFSLEEI